MKNILKKWIILPIILPIIVMLPMMFNSCDDVDTDSGDNPEDRLPPIVTPPEVNVDDLHGAWKVVSALRNNNEEDAEDISALRGFANFRLNINANGTYTIDNYMPFIVRDNGQWELDDPKLPLFINFKENAASAPVVTDFIFPIENNQRQLRILLSPGCSSNGYFYVFEKVSN